MTIFLPSTRTFSLPLSGQPSSSVTPLMVSGSAGHLSSASSTPSLSLSGSGQPSSSWKPSLSSAACGQRSLSSVRPSPSVSTGGGGGSSSAQPSVSSKPFFVSG